MSSLAHTLTIALAGNPNAGKTTLFNSLTGLKQKVANYPGVTVERKEGPWSLNGTAANLIDLPGLYSLDATSLDEQIASEIITGELAGVPKPDVIVAVVDATNLERNLYLVTQIFEFGVPVVVALTMIDVFEKQGHEIDVEMLAALLKTPVVAVNAKSGRGRKELAEKVAELTGTTPEIPYDYQAEDPDAGPHGKIFARYNFIANAVQESVWHSDHAKHRLSDKIDRDIDAQGLRSRDSGRDSAYWSFRRSSLGRVCRWTFLEKGFGGLSDLVKARDASGNAYGPDRGRDHCGCRRRCRFLPQILLLFLFISLLGRFGLHGPGGISAG